MSEWIVYSKDGLKERCSVKRLEYNGTWMGACSLSLDIDSPTPVDFEIGDYIEYRGERFEINYDPTVIKNSSNGSIGNSFSYKDVVFNSLSDELTRCDFLDYVPSDNLLHYSSLPNFTFFADSIEKLAERIQVNLDRVYKDEKKWTIEVHPEYVSKKDVNIVVNSITCWDALALVKSEFDANFIIRGRKVIIGTEGIAVDKLFSYGKGNGLVSIEKNAEADQKIITRLRAYGSTKNMPPRYYYREGSSVVPNNLSIQNLMMPGFPDSTSDPYIDSPNIGELGVREGTVFFDGSGDLPEIYPSMEGMTAEELKGAGISVNASGRLDEILSADQIQDNGVFEEGATIEAFQIKIKDVGFDINDHLSSSNATISMKNGMCGGRDFEIVSCEKTDDGYLLTCNRHYDQSLDLYFPYNNYQIKQGDQFVLLNIEMPDAYIQVASQQLYDAARAYLYKNDYVRYSYTPTVDNVFLARQHNEAVKNGSESIYQVIKEGDLFLFEDSDLGIEGSVIIDTLTITEDKESSLIPQYKITLRNDKTVGTIQKIQNQIDSIVSGKIGVSSDGGYNAAQIKSLIKSFGSTFFLRKDQDDIAKGVITFENQIKSHDFAQGNLMGAGWSIYRDGNGNVVVETDRMIIRKDLSVSELIVNQETFQKGSNIYVKGGCTITRVEEADTYYRCYFDNKDGEEFSGFVVGDQARCQRYDKSYQNVIKYYWRLVVDVGDDYVDLSKTDADGTGLPTEGDDIAQLGNRTDKTRQSAVVISPDSGGSVVIWAGINSFNLSEKNMIGMGVDASTGEAYFYGYGNMYMGDRNQTSFMRFTKNNGVEICGSLAVGTKLGDGRDLKEAIDSATPEGYQEFVDAVTKSLGDLQNQVDGAVDSFFLDYDPTLGNYPASEWTTDAQKEAHLGDTFTNNATGDSWRWGLVNGSYQWIYIEDTATKKALAEASKAKDTADKKRRVFTTTPKYTDSYDVGDLWVNATYGQYSNEILKCNTAKAANVAFDIAHWSKASKYTDDSSVNALKVDVNTLSGKVDKFGTDIEAVKQQTDREYTIWFFEYEPTLNNYPASDWTTPELVAEHDQDMFYYREAGKAWRFEDGSWKLIKDQDVLRALEQIAALQTQVSDFEPLREAFKDDETLVSGGLVMTSLLGVRNKENEVEAFLNGGDFAEDETHGKLLLAGGIPSGANSIEERAKSALTRFYEDGTIISGATQLRTKQEGGNLEGYTLALGAGNYTLPNPNGFIQIHAFCNWSTRTARDFSFTAASGNKIIIASETAIEGFVEYDTINLGDNTLYKFTSIPHDTYGWVWAVSYENLMTEA